MKKIYIEYALEMQKKYGVPASVILGQFQYESSCGTSHMARVANNCFGCKGKGPAGSYISPSGKKWRKYHNKKESFQDYARIVSNDRYSKYTKRSKDPKTFLEGLVKGDYCRDPGYVSNVMKIIRSNNYTKYDSAKSVSTSKSSGGSPISTKDIVSVAASQLGYKEQGNNRTKYGVYTGTNGQAWCHSFVSWCAYKAGQSGKVPKTASTTTGMNWFKSHGLFRYKGNYTPKRGDIVYFKTGRSHVGIVEKVTGNTLHTIEGNTSNRVARKTYPLSNKTITGYGVPKYSGGKTTGTAIGNISTGTTTADKPQKASKKEIAYLKAILKKKTTKAETITGDVEATYTLPEGRVTLVTKIKKKNYEITTKEKVEWTTERKGMPGKLTFESDYCFSMGDAVKLIVDGKDVFYGFVFSRSSDKEKSYKYTVYDQLRYLKNKDTYVYKNKRADQVLVAMAKRFNLKTGTIANTKFVIKKRAEDNASVFDIIQNALDETLMAKNKIYVLYDNVGKLTLQDITKMKVNTCLIDEETCENYSYKASIDADVYNQVKLVYANKKKGTYDLYVSKDTKNINKWGVLQYEDNIETPDIGKLKSQALLKLYNQLSRTITIDKVIGNVKVRAGSMVPVMLSIGDMTIKNYMLVEKAVHTIENGRYTMKLSVSGGGFSGQ